ncbi:pilus assembly protein [Rhizobium sp. P32RR-XVIII]|uniref:TadE/TadG family type IV pilus assembly protein n=1 Tax=Rhizobium sp. P32RR-XVIII TaxID=2726738 RepID=UPI001456B70B|nr:TadE/TadG family type IV pilus assembly protein [Rhizobium sp. P32RR-XVIII]NLS01887.1 pilus assembly protein [Rhizobium sp. P32RR-XVIII]
MAATGILMRLKAKLVHLGHDRSGVGAIEFAILFPVLVMLYIGAFETTLGLSVSKRASRAAGSIADLVTQQENVTKSSLTDIASVADGIFVPFDTTDIQIELTGIDIDTGANAKVLWSWANDAATAPYAANSPVSGIPAELQKADSFLVRADLSIPYKLLAFGPSFLPSNMQQITIRRTYYYRQRQGKDVTCGDC